MKKIKETKPRYPLFNSMHDIVNFVADSYGDSVLYKYYVGKEIREVSFNRYKDWFMGMGTTLFNRGWNGKRFAIVGESKPEWMCAFLAVMSAGGVIVPLDKELFAEQICNFVEYAECDGVIYTESHFDKVNDAKPSQGIFINLDDCEATEGRGHYTFSKLMEEGLEDYNKGNKTFCNFRPDTSVLASLVFTSGTTGTSKGVMLSQNNLLFNVSQCVNEVDFTADDVNISALPLHHTYECTAGNIAAMTCGVTICFNNSLKYFMKNVAIFKPTGLVLVPLFVNTIYRRITDEIEKKGKSGTVKTGMALTGVARKVGLDLRRNMFKEIIDNLGGNVTKIVCGGAAVNPDIVKWFDSVGIRIEQGYGITECSPLVAVNPSSTHKVGSVGRAAIGSSVKIIVDNNYGVVYEAETGEIGEICVKGPNVMLGYYNNPEATKEAFTADGYFRTGDYGYIDKDGYIFISGRKKNIIVLTNGKNVYPEEIEEYLENIDIIKECVVVGRENDDDVVLTAVLFPDYDKFKGMSEEDISAALRAQIMNVNRRLPSFKQIRGIVIRRVEFEKTPTKKIIRSKI
ncbi:MAG: AMP-binding protein [Clostridia bacterium]|nr:AMP-binding protein [Clostridia bacterium]